jgi:hypothetical protein
MFLRLLSQNYLFYCIGHMFVKNLFKIVYKFSHGPAIYL